MVCKEGCLSFRAGDVLCESNPTQEQLDSEFENFKKSKMLHSLIISYNDVEEECDKFYLVTMRNLTKIPRICLQPYHGIKF